LDGSVIIDESVPHSLGDEHWQAGDLGLVGLLELDVHGVSRLGVHGENRPGVEFPEEVQVLGGVSPALLVHGRNEGQIDPLGRRERNLMSELGLERKCRKEGVNLGDADFLHGDSSSICHFARPKESGIVLMNRIGARGGQNSFPPLRRPIDFGLG
jgi:hypothetical protein